MSIVKNLAKAKMEDLSVELHTKDGESLICKVAKLTGTEVEVLTGGNGKHNFLISHLISVEIVDEKAGALT